MKIKNIELADISRYRGELMGAAMLFIILFHVQLPRSDMFFGLRRMGNIGVDLFLFLSGIGLWFSWMKDREGENLRQKTVGFYLRRLLRIYPTWLVMASLFYVGDFMGAGKYSKNLADLLGDVLVNWDFWLHDELTFWYIPATMMLYLLAPPYMELIRRHPVYRWLPVVMVMWCVIVQWVTPIHQAVGHIEIFWSRVPIFFIGINMSEAVRSKQSVDGQAIWLILLMFGVALSASIFLEQVRHGQFPLFVERMLYIPLTVTTVLLLNAVFRHTPQWFNRALSFVGAVSLEIYLIHSHFVLVHLERLGWSYWPKFLACLAITLPLAWLLNKVIGLIVRPLEKRLK
ncbi:MAG: acyltransferase [Prevotella sp.]|nr:acyltransferase [Prevotella sp.]